MIMKSVDTTPINPSKPKPRLSAQKKKLSLTYSQWRESIIKGSQAGWLYREERERDIFISIIKLGL